MKIENARLLFDSGRELRVNMHIVGLRVDGHDPKLFDEGVVFGGYDDSFKTPEMFYDAECATDSDALSHAECVELADFMVARWAKFGADHAFVLAEAERQLRGTGSPETPVGLLNAGALEIDDFAALKDFKL